MGMQDTPELLKILYNTLGRRKTTLFVYGLVFVLFLIGARISFEVIDYFMTKFLTTSSILNWGILTNALIASIIVTLVMFAMAGSGGVLLGLLAAVIIRLGFNRSDRGKLNLICNDIEQVLDSVESTMLVDQEHIHILREQLLTIKKMSEFHAH